MVKFMIRPAGDKDHVAIMWVNRDAWEAAYAEIYTAQEIRKLFAGEITQAGDWVERRQSKGETLVAVIEDEVIGFVGVTRLKAENEGEITHLYVHPDYQGHGVGKALWNAGVQHLRDAQCERVWVWVLEKADAYAFYLHQGCKAQDEGIYRVGWHREKAIGCVLELT